MNSYSPPGKRPNPQDSSIGYNDPGSKKQRPSNVCLYCRRMKKRCDRGIPSCINCTRTGKLCVYDRVESSSLQPGQKNPNRNRLSSNSSNDSIQLSSSSTSDIRDGLTQLQRELDRLIQSRTEIAGLNNDPQPQEKSNTKYNNHDLIDLFGSANGGPESLGSFPNEAEGDIKPLNHYAFISIDPYFSLFKLFIFIYCQIGRIILDEIPNDDWRSTKKVNFSNWMNSVNGKFDYLKELSETTKVIFKEREFVRNSQILPFDGFIWKPDVVSQEIKSIFEGLNKSVIEGYLSYYFDVMWCYLPFIDQDSFRKDISSLLNYQNDGSIDLNISKTADLSQIAILLIVLRYAYTACQLLSTQTSESKHLLLLGKPIDIKAITTAELCINLYRMSHSYSVSLIQALLLLRYYERDSREGGDNALENKRRTLQSSVIQVALNLGINRDPLELPSVQGNIQLANLRRRLWNGILTMEVQANLKSGQLSFLPGREFCKVSQPIILRNDPLDFAMNKEWENSSKISELFTQITQLFNQLHTDVKVSDIESLLDTTNEFIVNHCGSFKPLPQRSNDYDCPSRVYTAIAYENTKALEHQVVFLTTELQIYHLLCCHYEMSLYADKEKYLYFFRLILEKIHKATDLGLSYLTSQLDQYIPESSNFCLYPLINCCLFLAIQISMSTIFHLQHASKLLQIETFSRKSETNPHDLEPLINKITSQSACMSNLLREKVSCKTWFGLKIGVGLSQGMYALSHHGFGTIEDVVQFFQNQAENDYSNNNSNSNATNDHPKEHINQRFGNFEMKKKIKESILGGRGMKDVAVHWVKVSGRATSSLTPNAPNLKSVLVNVNQTNIFLNVSQDELKNLMAILDSEMIHFKNFHEECNKWEVEPLRSNSVVNNGMSVKGSVAQLLNPIEPSSSTIAATDTATTYSTNWDNPSSIETNFTEFDLNLSLKLFNDEEMNGKSTNDSESNWFDQFLRDFGSK